MSQKRSFEEYSKSHQETDEEQLGVTLAKHLISLFASVNNNCHTSKKPLMEANAIIRTSFKDYNVHDLFVKRSGLFKIMLESHDTWKLEKKEGKPMIDLISMEKSIFSDESDLRQDEFEAILRYLYSDEFTHEEFDCLSVKRIVYIAKFLDLPSLNEKLLKIYCNEENLPYTSIYFQIKHILDVKLTEFDFLQIVFNQYMDCKYFSNELVDLICQQEIVPLEFKLKLLNEQIKEYNQMVTTITNDHLKPFEKSIPTIVKQAKGIFKGQVLYFHNFMELANLLGIDLSPTNSGTTWNPTEDLLSTQLLDDYLLQANVKYYPTIKLFEERVVINVKCSENNSAYWWDLSVQGNDFETQIYYQQSSKPIVKVKWNEFTIYAPQFQTQGESIKLLVVIKKEKKN